MQSEFDPLGFPQVLHRKVGMGKSGVNHPPDSADPRLYHTFITFSLDIRQALAKGDIVPGLGVRCNPRQAAADKDSWEVWAPDEDEIYATEDPDAWSCQDEEDDIYSSDDSDALHCEKDDVDSFQDPGCSRGHSNDRGRDASGAQVASAVKPGAASKIPYVVDD